MANASVMDPSILSVICFQIGLHTRKHLFNGVHIWAVWWKKYNQCTNALNQLHTVTSIIFDALSRIAMLLGLSPSKRHQVSQ